MPISIPDFSIYQQSMSEGFNPDTSSEKFTAEIGKSLLIYRVGIGELQFNPLNIQVSENITMNNEIQSDIYGKTNPFVSYTNTIRSFNFSFLLNAIRPHGFIPDAATGLKPVDGNSMMQLVNILKSFLYANYERKQNDSVYARTIKSPPIFKIKFKNLVSNGDSGNNAKEFGLVGAIKDFKLEPYYNAGYVPFGKGETKITATESSNPIDAAGTYSEMKVSFSFYPIFEEPLGWELNGETKNFSGKKELGGMFEASSIKKILGG